MSFVGLRHVSMPGSWYLAAIAILFLLPTISFADLAEKLTLRNESLAVTVDSATSEFSIESLPAGRTIVSAGKLAGLTGKIATRDVNDKVFGAGQAVTISDATGASGEIVVYPKLPFALIHLTLKNAGAEARNLNRVPVASFDASPSEAELKIRGTGGLAPASKEQGSYEWIVVADEHSRNGVVAGFLTHDRATGVLFSSPNAGHVKVEARGEYGRLRLAPGATAETETLAIGYFDDARLGLEAWADAIAREYNIKLPPQPAGYCTWYSDKHGGAGDEKSLAELSSFTAKELAPFGFGFIQIDDGWQQGEKRNGPRKNFTDFRAEGPYASGMKQTADRIKADGLMPGIWFMPFAGTYNDPWFADRKDLFAKRADGTPYDTAWGGTCLDMTNPAARDYLRTIVKKIAGDWGYTYFKMDGMWTGLAAKQIYINSGYKEDGFGDAVLADPNKTNIEAIRDGLKLVRAAAGPKVFFLGCNIAQNMRAYGGTFGLLDAMRIGPDNNGSWEGWHHASPIFGSRHYFLNGRVWYNDPDPNYVRAKLPLDEARTIATWTAISGQLNTNSDWIPGLLPERLDLLKRTMPAHGRTARPVDFFENDPPRIWQVTDSKTPARRDVIALYNWDAKETEFDVPLSQFNLPESDEYAGFDFWANAFLPPIKGTLKSSLPAHGCQAVAIRPMLDRPFLLSTGRHITQGMVDVVEEKWDAQAKALPGKSRVVAGDTYELRIIAPRGQNWKASAVEVSAEDKAAGVEAKFDQAGTGVRVNINSPASREVKWKVSFD